VAVLEGVHALKHALRFGAAVDLVVTPARAQLARLLDELAPDVTAVALARSVEASGATWAELVPRGLPSPALSLAARPATDLATIVADPRPAPVVLLEDPTHLGNLGAAVRVAAAADAAGLLTTGHADPWSPAAIRGAAGLQYAVPTVRIDELVTGDRPVVAVDPEGAILDGPCLPPRAVLAFGTERGGLSPALLRRAEHRVRIPMRPGVSSLNLATAVAVVLYAWEADSRRE
jgi:TrmH family RNA methyltransferase